MLNRPGFHTSEFLASLVNLIVQVALAMNGTVSDGTATKYSVAGAIAFILSRGLAKYEGRGTAAVPPTTPGPVA
jgi:hypothetical protein